MSRLDDLIDLIQTTNEVYFITAPGRVRTAYILVDDIVELALKTYLQEKALEQREKLRLILEQAHLVTSRNHRNALDDYFEETIDLLGLSNHLGLGTAGIAQLQTYISALTPINMLQHWSANDPVNFKNYHEVILDVKPFFTLGIPIHTMLDEAVARHQVRNTFYHDHKQTGLTIDDDKCLRALCGMFNLLENLFPGFHASIQANKTIRCQIGVLRLKLAAHGGANELVKPYYAALAQLKSGHQFDFDPRSVEHSLVHTVSERFFLALREQFRASISELQFRVDGISRMSHPQTKHQRERADKQELMRIFQGELTDLDSLI